MPVGDPGLVGHGRHGGDDGRDDALAVDRHGSLPWNLSRDLNALPLLLVGCVAAFGVTVLLLRRSILTEKLARRGQHIAREYSVDLFELMRVGEVMDKDAPTVSADTTVAELSDRIARRRPGRFPPPGHTHSGREQQAGGHHHARRHCARAAKKSRRHNDRLGSGPARADRGLSR